MNLPETNDPIENLLHEQDAPVADNGFTRRVMARLPRRRPLFPRIILLIVVAVGALLAGFWMPWGNLPPLDFTKALPQDSNVLSAWFPFAVVIVALASAASAALRQED